MKPNSTGAEGEVLLHGTKPQLIRSIRKRGLIPHRWNNGMPPMVCLTVDTYEAYLSAGESLDSVLAVDVSDLPLVRLGWIACLETIGPERVTLPPKGTLYVAFMAAPDDDP